MSSTVYRLKERFYYPSSLDGEFDLDFVNNRFRENADLEENDTLELICKHKLSEEEYKRIHKPMCASLDDKVLYILKPVKYYDGKGLPFVYYKMTKVYNNLNGILDMYDNEFTQNILLIKSIGFTDAIEAGEVYTMLKDNVPNFDIEEEDDLGDDSDIDFIIHD